MCLFCLFSVIISCPILYFNSLVSPRQVGFAYFRFSSLVLHLHCTLSILFLFCYILCFSLRLLCIYSFYHLLHPSAVALFDFHITFIHFYIAFHRRTSDSSTNIVFVAITLRFSSQTCTTPYHIVVSPTVASATLLRYLKLLIDPAALV